MFFTIIIIYTDIVEIKVLISYYKILIVLDKFQNERKPSEEIAIVNERIKFAKVRVISNNGIQLGIFNTKDAIELAEKDNMDLGNIIISDSFIEKVIIYLFHLLVSDKSDPPVCRILDYGKYKFTQEKRAREARKKQHNVTIKEVKMRYKIEEHDYKVRVNQAIRFLEAGDKVKATVVFKGREIQHSDLAIELLNKLAKDLSELSEIQQKPLRDGKNIIMLFMKLSSTIIILTDGKELLIFNKNINVLYNKLTASY
uniref:Translation initiation factor IF-3, chloroplastic n=1 Tax=Compsopogon caeruleus TaxID=31354 RepID=A0A1Z1XBC9_9RHOD|nr:translation initiation factor 3 [Compsopogon caeruleus]ARX96172.1 translation initiation factor 3 [Compsopogon caeruleus]